MQAFQLWWQFVMHILQEPVFFCLSTSRLWEEGVGGVEPAVIEAEYILDRSPVYLRANM